MFNTVLDIKEMIKYCARVEHEENTERGNIITKDDIVNLRIELNINPFFTGETL